MVTPAEAPFASFRRRRHLNSCAAFLCKPLRSHAVIARTLQGFRFASEEVSPQVPSSLRFGISIAMWLAYPTENKGEDAARPRGARRGRSPPTQGLRFRRTTSRPAIRR
jgi:hypothetical protein